MSLNLWIAAVGTSFVLGACGAGASNHAASNPMEPADEVEIAGLAFRPETLTIPRGTSVLWRNGDAVPHTITAGEQGEQGAPGVTEDQPGNPTGLFDEELDGEGDTFRYTFDNPGSYDYYCDIHRQMTARVIVE